MDRKATVVFRAREGAELFVPLPKFVQGFKKMRIYLKRRVPTNPVAHDDDDVDDDDIVVLQKLTLVLCSDDKHIIAERQNAFWCTCCCSLILLIDSSHPMLKTGKRFTLVQLLIRRRDDQVFLSYIMQRHHSTVDCLVLFLIPGVKLFLNPR